MNEQIQKPILEVRKRLDSQARNQRLFFGLAVCSCIMLGVVAVAMQLELRWLLLAAPACLLGTLLFVLNLKGDKRGMVRAANVIDAKYDWKDMVVSAWEFSQQPSNSHMEKLSNIFFPTTSSTNSASRFFTSSSN